jgi:alkyl sulfatase BDS1-like metallo-beta-lactamase superfamily hydrolase
LNVEFTHEGEKWLLELEHGVLQYYENQEASDADVTLTLSADEFRKVAEGKTTIDDAVKAGDVKLSGSQGTLDEFLSLFDTFDAWYNVVTPVVAK